VLKKRIHNPTLNFCYRERLGIYELKGMGNVFSKRRKSTAAAPTSTIISVQSNPPGPSKKPNLNGFQDDNWYKIRNVGDNNVVQLEVDSNNFICTQENEDKLDVQLFRAVRQSNGSYRIMVKFQKPDSDAPEVWDYLPSRKILRPMEQSTTEKHSQNWKSEAVPGFNSLYLIQSTPDPQSFLCLKNTGVGEQLKLIKKDNIAIADNFTHWYLELQD